MSENNIKGILDVTMEKLKEELIISEEVTLEMPSITKNLEEFKKAIEEEIKHEDENTTMQVQLSPDKSLLESAKYTVFISHFFILLVL